MSDYSFDIVDSLPSISRKGAGGGKPLGERNRAALDALLKHVAVDSGRYLTYGPTNAIAQTAATMSNHCDDGIKVTGLMRTIDGVKTGFLTLVTDHGDDDVVPVTVSKRK